MLQCLVSFDCSIVFCCMDILQFYPFIIVDGHLGDFQFGAGIKQLWTLGYKSLHFHFSTRQLFGKPFASSWTSFPGIGLWLHRRNRCADLGAKTITQVSRVSDFWVSLSWVVFLTMEHVHKKVNSKVPRGIDPTSTAVSQPYRSPSQRPRTLTSFFCNLLEMSYAHKSK